MEEKVQQGGGREEGGGGGVNHYIGEKENKKRTKRKISRAYALVLGEGGRAACQLNQSWIRAV